MSFSTLISDQNKDSFHHFLFSMLNFEDPAEHIRVNSFYEVDHSKLPHKSPHQLNIIRIVMVNEKTRMRVSLRFPSIYSLRAYFNESEYNTTKKDMKKKLPAFDEKHMIGSEVAAEALYRRISAQEIADKSCSWSFWVRKNPSVSPRKVPADPPTRILNVNVGARELSLMSELKGTGMVKWGQRRQVRFLAKHVEDRRQIVTVSNDLIKGEEEKDSDGDDTEETEEEEDVKVVVNKSSEAKRKLRKRKCQVGSGKKSSLPKKRPKSEKKNQIVVCKQKKNKAIKKSIDRWSAERYKLAEHNMLKVMKEQNAVFGKPILRPELRAEARKLIGDTGLLDHLLKHMAGKLAPGGEERFRRRHNADGAMEYWLEKANLVDVRKEAGVQDPYWTPPPGWKLGDNPTQDPVSARKIKKLEEEIEKVKREMAISNKNGKELAIVAVPISSPTSQDVESGRLLIPLKEMYTDLVNKKLKLEEQLMEISRSLCGMEEEMEKLKTSVEKSKRKESTERPALLVESTESNKSEAAGRKRKEAMHQEKEGMVLGESAQEHSKSSGGNIHPTTDSPAPTEDRSAKIERLKSGFRICKPQASFLWPDMTTSTPHPQVAAQLQDLIAVHTPPSVSSALPKQSYLLFSPPSQTRELCHTPPVKPVAERRPVTIPQSTAVITPITFPPLDQMTRSQEEECSISTSTTTTTKTPLINLNEPLYTNQTDDYGLFCESQSHAQTSSYPVTYQRRHHQNVTTTIAMPNLESSKKEMMSQAEECDQRKGTMIKHRELQQQRECSSAPSIASSSMLMGGRTWLALATSKPSVDNKSKRGG